MCGIVNNVGQPVGLTFLYIEEDRMEMLRITLVNISFGDSDTVAELGEPSFKPAAIKSVSQLLNVGSVNSVNLGDARDRVKVDGSSSLRRDVHVWIRNYGKVSVYHQSQTCMNVPGKRHRKMRLDRAISAGLRPCSFCGHDTDSGGLAESAAAA
jgi:hypothetical protein